MPRSTDFLPSLPKPSISSIKHDWAQAVFRKKSVWHPLKTFFWENHSLPVRYCH